MSIYYPKYGQENYRILSMQPPIIFTMASTSRKNRYGPPRCQPCKNLTYIFFFVSLLDDLIVPLKMAFADAFVQKHL